MAASYVELLRCVGLPLVKVAARSAGNAVGFGFLGDVLVDVAEEAWSLYSQRGKPAEIELEVQALAQASTNEYHTEVALAVEAISAGQPPAVIQTVESYLKQMPAMVRRTWRRPSDPSGRTLPPGLNIRKAEDLLVFLPQQLPRFQVGMFPLPGVDLELVELLGVGGFGEVWKARNPHRSKAPPAALKFCIDANAARMLRNEVAVLDHVMNQDRHPGIVELRQTYLRADPPCLEFEYVEGGDLAGLIQEWHRSGTPPTSTQAAQVVAQLAEIVAHAHRQDPPIVHRDLKPANILVPRMADGPYRFKIADFGIGGLAARQAILEVTRSTNARSHFLTTAVRGTYTDLYASPQQKRGGSPDPRDDVYSLGVIWYQVLTGNLSDGRPGGTRWTRKLADLGMSADLIDLLAGCFEDDPSDRPGSALVLHEELRRRLEGATGAAPSPPLPVAPSSAKPATPASAPSPPAKVDPPRDEAEGEEDLLLAPSNDEAISLDPEPADSDDSGICLSSDSGIRLDTDSGISLELEAEGISLAAPEDEALSLESDELILEDEPLDLFLESELNRSTSKTRGESHSSISGKLVRKGFERLLGEEVTGSRQFARLAGSVGPVYGLALQGLGMAWIATNLHPTPPKAGWLGRMLNWSGGSGGVWGIELGQSSLKALRLEKVNGDAVATDFYYFEYPKRGNISEPDSELLGEDALARFLQQNDLRGDTVVLGINGQSGLVRVERIPPVEMKKIPDIARFEAKQSIPFPLEEVVWDWQLLTGSDPKDELPIDQDLLLAAIKRDFVQRYLKLFQDAGVRIGMVQLISLALVNFLSYDVHLREPGTGPLPRNSEGVMECTAAVEIGTQVSTLVVTDGKTLLWQRILPLGGEHLTRALMKELKLTREKAEKLKRNPGLVSDQQPIFVAVRPVLRDLLDELQRSLGYFENVHRKARLTTLLALGRTWHFPGLQKFISVSLNREIVRQGSGPPVSPLRLFAYEGMNREGTEVKGTMRALSEEEAMNQLRAMSIFVIKITETKVRS